MKMLRNAAPAKPVLVLKFTIFVIICGNGDKSVRLEQFRALGFNPNPKPKHLLAFGQCELPTHSINFNA